MTGQEGDRSGLSIEELRSVARSVVDVDRDRQKEQQLLSRQSTSQQRERANAAQRQSRESTFSSTKSPTIAKIPSGSTCQVPPTLEPSSASSSSSLSSTHGDCRSPVLSSSLPEVLRSPRTYSLAGHSLTPRGPEMPSLAAPSISYRLREEKGGKQVDLITASSGAMPGAYSVAERASGPPPAWDWRSRHDGAYLYPPGTSPEVMLAVEGRLPTPNRTRARSPPRRYPARTISPIPVNRASSPIQAILAPSEEPLACSSPSSSSLSDPSDLEDVEQDLNVPAPLSFYSLTELGSSQTNRSSRDPVLNHQDRPGSVDGTTMQPQSQPVGQATQPKNGISRVESGTNNKKDGKYLPLWLVGMIVVFLAVGIFVGVWLVQFNSERERQSINGEDKVLAVPISRPERWSAFRKRLEYLSPDPSVLDDPTTPQYQALEWLVLEDEETMLTETSPVTQKIIADQGAQETWYRRVESRYALAVLYYSTDGDHWKHSFDYMSPTVHECDWCKTFEADHVSSIRCDESSQLTELVMNGNRMVGTIPHEIVALSNLKMLDFSSNKLRSKITHTISRLSELEYLRLGNNSLSGTFQNSFSLLTNLREINVTHNQLTSTFMTSLSRSEKMTNPFSLWFLLEVLDISHNGFTGTVPGEIQRLFKLRELHIGHNHFTGYLPSASGSRRFLEVFDGSHNEFTGNFDWEELVASFGRMRHVDVSHNLLDDILPPKEFDGSDVTLEYLDMSHNPCNDCGDRGREIPDSIAQLTNLKELRLSDIGLVGTIPSRLGELEMLQVLDLSSNRLSSTLPSELSRLSSLRQANFYSNSLEGDIEFMCPLFPNFNRTTTTSVAAGDDTCYREGIVADCVAEDNLQQPKVICSSCCWCQSP